MDVNHGRQGQSVVTLIQIPPEFKNIVQGSQNTPFQAKKINDFLGGPSLALLARNQVFWIRLCVSQNFSHVDARGYLRACKL